MVTSTTTCILLKQMSTTSRSIGVIAIRGHPYMTSALRGVSTKEDVVREVA